MENYSGSPSTFEGGGSYVLSDLLESGHIISISESYEIKRNSAFGAGITEASSHPIPTFLYAIIAIIGNVNILTWDFRFYQSLIYVFLLLSGSLLFFGRIQDENQNNNFGSRKSKELYYGLTLFLISLFTLLATPTVINLRGANGWFLLYFSFYFLFLAKNTIISKTLALIFLIMIPFFYFTSSTFFLMYLLILFSYFLIRRDQYKKYITIVLFYIVVWFSYGIYISAARYTGLIGIMENMIRLIRYGTVETGVLAIPSEFLISTSFNNKIFLLVNALFVGLVILFFLIKRKDILPKRQYTEVLFVATILLLPLWGLLATLWQGSFGIPRLLEYGTLFAVIILSSLFFVFKSHDKKILAVIVICAIITSSVGYITDENSATLWITYSEESSIQWINEYTRIQDVIFTDHRIGGALLASGHVKVTGITQERFGNRTINVVDSIYYNNNITQAVKYLDMCTVKNQKISYLIFSDQMTKNIPGIKLYEAAFKPAPTGFTSEYDGNSRFARVYDAGNSTVYKMSS